MAKLGGTFDAAGVEPNAPLEALPPATTRSRSCSPRCGSPRPAPARCSGSTWRCWRGRSRPARLRPAEPDQPEPDRRGDRAAHARPSAMRSAAPGRGQRGAALPAILVQVAVKPNGYNEVKGYKPVSRSRQPPRRAPAANGPARPPRARFRQPERRRARRRRRTRPRPGRGALDPEEGSAVADRVWRHGGDGAFPTGIRRTSMEDGR